VIQLRHSPSKSSSFHKSLSEQIDEDRESVIGQRAIRSQFAREASRILLSPSIASGNPCLTLPFLSHCLFVQDRVALRVNGSRRHAKSHRSQRHLLHDTNISTACFVSLFFSNEEAGVGGRAKSAPCERGTEAPFRHFPRSALASRVAGCFETGGHRAQMNRRRSGRRFWGPVFALAESHVAPRICVAGCSPCMCPFLTVYFAPVRMTILRKPT